MVSKFCIFVVWNSRVVHIIIAIIVVNWFQNFVSLWSETVFCSRIKWNSSCELVSKFCIFVVWNSDGFLTEKYTDVVNWFQNFVSLWSETVWYRGCVLILLLWIGFKILYLCGLKQFEALIGNIGKCCELVSKFCIFVVWNSF